MTDKLPLDTHFVIAMPKIKLINCFQ